MDRDNSRSVVKMTGLLIEYLSHPGETLQEILESSNMTQKELAAKIGMSSKHVNQIISGVRPVMPETALKLEKVFSLSATFWNNLQKKYEEERSKILGYTAISKQEKAGKR